MLDLSGVAGILSINGAMDGFSGMLDFGAGGGQLRLNSNSSSSQDRNFGSAGAYFALGNGSAGLTNRNGNIAIQLGALSGGGSTSLSGRQSGSGDTSTTYYIGALDADTTFAGTIYQGGDLGGLNIVKVGSGVWTLSGASNIDGSFVVQEGTLALSGSLACSEGLWIESDAALDLQGGTLTTDTLEISEGALFSGSGIIDGELVNQGAMTSISGTLTVTGSVENSGTLTIKSGAQLIANGPFVNYGILDLLTASSSMPSNLNNLGVVIDSSGLEVLDSAIVVDDFELTIMTYSGHVYQFQHSDSLAADSWEPVGTPIAGNGSSVTFVQTDGAVGAKRFFRVLVD